MAFEVLLWLLRIVLGRLVHAYLRPLVHAEQPVPEGGAIVAANHPTVVDGVLLGLWAPRPVRFLVAGHLFDNPFMGWFLRWTRCIPVGRGGALERAEEALREGDLLGIFPEGDITGREALGPLHTGVARLALKTGAPVVPLGIAGTLSAFPPRTLFLRSGPVVLEVGEPIRFDPQEPEPDAVQAALLRIGELLDRQAARARAALPAAPRPGRLGVWLAGLVVVPVACLLRASEPYDPA
ncbi:MAG: lysophospholipid acyltransferase family protein [Candidatus Eremiobacterota bacterium]